VRAERHERLGALRQKLTQALPWLRDSDDAHARVTDHTFDIGERERVDPAKVLEAQTLARSWGLRSTRSSIHLHISLEQHDKATGTLALLWELLRLDPTTALQQWMYVGDSENDAPCLAGFRLSVGVANLRGLLSVPPYLLTRAARGAGFAELGRALLASRQPEPAPLR
jgi:hydroxymethylpyrimidine pyrophosphatase-like HAD family hydrolase